jgi:hypothetical protein
MARSATPDSEDKMKKILVPAAVLTALTAAAKK